MMVPYGPVQQGINVPVSFSCGEVWDLKVCHSRPSTYWFKSPFEKIYRVCARNGGYLVPQFTRTPCEALLVTTRFFSFPLVHV